MSKKAPELMITYTKQLKAGRWEYGIIPTPGWFVPLGVAPTQLEATGLVNLASQNPIDVVR